MTGVAREAGEWLVGAMRHCLDPHSTTSQAESKSCDMIFVRIGAPRCGPGPPVSREEGFVWAVNTSGHARS